MSGDGARRAALAVAWGLVFSVAAYAVLRAVQRVVLGQPDPAAVSWSPHAGYFWRAWTVSFAGGVAAFAAFVLARGRMEAAARALGPAIAVAAGLLALQSALLP